MKNKITLKQVKKGAQLPPAIYNVKPYVVLSKEGVVIAAGDLDYLKNLDGYFDEFPVEVRRHDLHANDNSKREVAQSAFNQKQLCAVKHSPREDFDASLILDQDAALPAVTVAKVTTSGLGTAWKTAHELERRWNTHDRLVEALESALKYIEVKTAYTHAMDQKQIQEAVKHVQECTSRVSIGHNSCNELASFDLVKARQAIKDAKGDVK